MNINPRPDQELAIQEAIRTGLISSEEDALDIGLENLRIKLTNQVDKENASLEIIKNNLVNIFNPVRGDDLDFFESTAGQIAEELLLHGVPTEQRVIVTIDFDHELIPGRLASRMRVMAAGLTTDDEIDRLIEEAREEVQPYIK